MTYNICVSYDIPQDICILNKLGIIILLNDIK